MVVRTITMMMNKKRLAALEADWKAQGGTRVLKAPKGKALRLPLTSVRVLPDLYQARGQHVAKTGVVDRSHVASLVTALRSRRGADLDPVTILRVGDQNILIDGHHRLAAYQAQKLKTIPVRYFSGSPTDALLEAGRENGKARLQMTKVQCSERAWALVLAGQPWTVTKIAEGAGISERRVYDMRRRHRQYLEAGEEPPASWRDVNYADFDADPNAIPKMVAEWAEGIGKVVGSPARFNTTGKVQMLGEALVQWSQPLTVLLAKYLIDSLDLRDEARAIQELRAAEEVDEDALEF